MSFDSLRVGKAPSPRNRQFQHFHDHNFKTCDIRVADSHDPIIDDFDQAIADESQLRVFISCLHFDTICSLRPHPSLVVGLDFSSSPTSADACHLNSPSLVITRSAILPVSACVNCQSNRCNDPSCGPICTRNIDQSFCDSKPRTLFAGSRVDDDETRANSTGTVVTDNSRLAVGSRIHVATLPTTYLHVCWSENVDDTIDSP